MLLSGAGASGFPTQLWTLARIAKRINREFGHAFSTIHLWQVVRELGRSRRRPIGRAAERDGAAILEGKAKRWPA